MNPGFKPGLNSLKAKTKQANIRAFIGVSKVFRNERGTPEITTYVAFKSFRSQVPEAVKHWIIRGFTPMSKGQTHNEQTGPNKECFT